MEVIPQETISKQVGNRNKVLLEQPQKKVEIPFFHEDIFTVHAAIVDVIIGVVEQRRRTGHLYVQILIPCPREKRLYSYLAFSRNRRASEVSGSTVNATLHVGIPCKSKAACKVSLPGCGV